MGLSRAMIGILSQDDDLHLVERREIEGIENQWARGIDGILPFLADEKGLQVDKVGCLKLWSQHLVPAFIDIGFLYFHLYQLFSCQLFSYSVNHTSIKSSAKMVINREKIRYFANQIS